MRKMEDGALSRQVRNIAVSADWGQIYSTLFYPKDSKYEWKIGYRDDVIKWNNFPRYWPFVRGIRRFKD